MIILTTIVLIAASLPTVSGNPSVEKKENLERVGCQGILHRSVQTVIKDPEKLSESESRRKAVAEKFDRAKLLYTSRVVVDRSDELLLAPADIKPLVNKGMVIAKNAPLIEFGIVPHRPFFFAAPPANNRVGPWSNWSQGNFHKASGKFYAAVGDHGAYDAHIYLVEYDPATQKIKMLPEINAVLGRKKTEFSEGKIHGWLDFYPADSSNLWFCTYWAKYPEPEEVDWQTGYEGGHIMSYNVATGDIIDYGVPLKRASWPYHRIDTQRGILYAVGMFGEFLAWDIKEQKTLWAGYLPEGMGWWERAILIDENTGMVYTSNRNTADIQKHMVKYDPLKNRFFKLACHMPPDQETTQTGPAGGFNHLRAHTARRGPDGLFWCVTYSGELFTFDPVKEEVISKGINWPGKQRYTTSMDRSPGGRYIYYLPGGHGRAFVDGAPVIQLDTKSGSQKVLAFLYPYLYEKYGYVAGGTYCLKLDDTGERLFILWNGAFVDVNEQLKKENVDTFGQCSVMLLHIPQEERIE
jgi:hypothetical protein